MDTQTVIALCDLMLVFIGIIGLFPGEEGVTDGVGKEEAGPHAKVDPA